MKTMKKADEITRVSNDQVDEHLKNGWAFCKKTEWKQKVRDKNKNEKKPASHQKDPTRPQHQKGEKPVSKYRAKQADNSN